MEFLRKICTSILSWKSEKQNPFIIIPKGYHPDIDPSVNKSKIWKPEELEEILQKQSTEFTSFTK